MKILKTKKKEWFYKSFYLSYRQIIKKHFTLLYNLKLSSKQNVYLKDCNVVKNLLKFFAHKFLSQKKVHILKWNTQKK